MGYPRVEKSYFANILAWENNRLFATLQTVSPRNDVWETSIEIPYWWRVTTKTWVNKVMLLIGHAMREICFNQSEALPRSWSIVTPHQNGISALVSRTTTTTTKPTVLRCRENSSVCARCYCDLWGQCHSGMDIPIPKTLVIWASALTLTQIAKVIWEGDAHIAKVLGMGMPKTRGVRITVTGRQLEPSNYSIGIE